MRFACPFFFVNTAVTFRASLYLKFDCEGYKLEGGERVPCPQKGNDCYRHFLRHQQTCHGRPLDKVRGNSKKQKLDPGYVPLYDDDCNIIPANADRSVEPTEPVTWKSSKSKGISLRHSRFKDPGPYAASPRKRNRTRWVSDTTPRIQGRC